MSDAVPVSSDAQSPASGGQPDVIHQSTRSLPLLVLVVDDEDPITETLAYVIVSLGFRAARAPNGRIALSMALAEWPALVITDLMMPQMSGAKFIAALRAEAQQRGIAPPPCVVITAAGYHVARAAGADVVLIKPFELIEIESLLHRFLDHRVEEQ